MQHRATQKRLWGEDDRMFDVIVVSHGLLCKELIASAEMIAGEQEDVCAIGLQPGCNLKDFQEEIDAAFKKASEHGRFLVLTDLMYGTPFNIVTSFMIEYDCDHFSGINLPILLEVLTSRNCKTLPEICTIIKTEGKHSFIYVNDLLNQEEE